MITMALLGAALGATFFALLLVAVPPRVGNLVQLGRFYAHYRTPNPHHPTTNSSTDGGPGGLVGAVGARVVAELTRRGISLSTVRADLAVTGQNLDALLGRKVLAGTGGFFGAAIALSVVRYVGGVGLPPGTPIVAAALLGAALFLAPDVDLRRDAARRRAEFTEQLSIYLDLVSLRMAGHAAAAAALPEAARRGGGWPMILIRDTLFRARMSGDNEWDALQQLGARIAVPELRELGALVKLVADDGAQVRATLTARAASLRRARLASEEGQAEERNQSMRLAHMLIAIGFMIFIGYPAFANIHL